MLSTTMTPSEGFQSINDSISCDAYLDKLRSPKTTDNYLKGLKTLYCWAAPTNLTSSQSTVLFVLHQIHWRTTWNISDFRSHLGFMDSDWGTNVSTGPF